MLGILKFFTPIYCKREVLGKSYDLTIDGINAKLHFPEIDESRFDLGFNNHLLEPSIIKKLRYSFIPLDWGKPMNCTNWDCCVNRVVITIDCENTILKEYAGRIYGSIERWVYSFFQLLKLETKQDLERNYDTNSLCFLQLYDYKYISNQTPIILNLNLRNANSFASKEQIAYAISFAGSGKELLLQYQLLLSAYLAVHNNDNRKAVIDACSALEFALVEQIEKYCFSNGIDPDQVLKEYSSLGNRIDYIISIDKDFPKNDYSNIIVKPRNSLVHNRSINPENGMTIKLLSLVEEVLRYYYPVYY